ncbi:hypothetical protein TNCV_4758121 [Trichonephila clavipes]|nr:hypothetical protein TNCV_4758121 [Trichonephila clavipes]
MQYEAKKKGKSGVSTIQREEDTPKGTSLVQKEEESNRTVPTLWNKKGQVVRMTEAEEHSNNNARKGVDDQMVGDHRVWRS